MSKYLLAVALMAFVGQAAAASPLIVKGNASPFERVRVADLNLRSQAGIATLQGRIRSAAERLCVTQEVEPVAMKLEEMRCYRTARDTALREVERIAAAQSRGAATAAPGIGSLR